MMVTGGVETWRVLDVPLSVFLISTDLSTLLTSMVSVFTTKNTSGLFLSSNYSLQVVNSFLFSNATFPNNLEEIYDTHFGFVSAQTGRALVIGEWGGYYTGKDKIIQDYQADYFNRKGISGNFYWALNPNPGGMLLLLLSFSFLLIKYLFYS